jgi:hypothetical protein
MLYREIIAVCSQIHTKHWNGQKSNFLDSKPGGTVHKITTTLKGKLVTAEQDTELFNSANYSIWMTTCSFRDSNLATGVHHYSARSLCVLSRCRRSLVYVILQRHTAGHLAEPQGVSRQWPCVLWERSVYCWEQSAGTERTVTLPYGRKVPASNLRPNTRYSDRDITGILNPSRKSETSIQTQSSDGHRLPNSLPEFFFIIKPTRCTNLTNLFWHETLHVSRSSYVHHQEFIHCTLSNGIYHTGL